MKISYYLARRIIFTAFVSVSLMAFGAAISAVSARDRYGAILKEIEGFDARYASATTEGSDVCYLVREHDGIIGVFTAEGDLEYTIEVYVRTLPEADRRLLSDGIFAQNKAELLEILGDYNG